MKRRNFVKTLGAGISTGYIIQNQSWQNINPYQEKINTLEEALSKEGLLMVRVAITGKNANLKNLNTRVKVDNGKIDRMKTYFFENNEDDFSKSKSLAEVKVNKHDEDVLVLWLKNVEKDTVLRIQADVERKINLPQLLEGEQGIDLEDGTIVINLLFDKEIGEIKPEELGIPTGNSDFRFTILADPQGGNPKVDNTESPTRMKIHNAFIEETIELINNLKPQPVFNLVLGDFVDSKGQEGHFKQMLEYHDKLKTPYLIEVGNHETAYSAKFRAYDMSALDNFFAAQKQANGMDKILYSFDLGQWHFIVWPDPLRSSFFPTHPHYFDWLEQDLEKNKKRPTIFMQHIPIHPIGINPLINYAESPEVKKLLMKILTGHGNVKYVFSGHVHIPLKASVKTAVEYEGIKFVNLPAAGFRPRAFGEADYYGGPSQGMAVLDIKNENVKLSFHTVSGEVFQYPEKFEQFDPAKYPLWLNYTWELEANKELLNGNFSAGLAEWHKRFVHQEDKSPSNICEVKSGAGKNDSPALYLYSRERGYPIPGQDRLPQDINRVCQVIELQSEALPEISIDFLLEQEHFHPGALSSFYIWIEGFAGSQKKMNVVYAPGKMMGGVGGRYAQSNVVHPMIFDLPAKPGQWQNALLNLSNDFKMQSEETQREAGMNKLAINLGVWTINDGLKQESGVLIDNVKIIKSRDASNVGGTPVTKKQDEDIYYRKVDHVAGEHIIAPQETIWPY